MINLLQLVKRTIWPIDKILIVTANPGKSRLGSNDNEEVRHTRNVRAPEMET